MRFKIIFSIVTVWLLGCSGCGETYQPYRIPTSYEKGYTEAPRPFEHQPRRVLRKCPVCGGTGKIRREITQKWGYSGHGYSERTCVHCWGTGGIWVEE